MVLNQNELKISRIFHAGYILEGESQRIAFDPLFENPFSFNCYVYPECRVDYSKISAWHFDAVFISHIHDDHFSLKSLNHLKRSTPIYIFSVSDEAAELLQEMGFESVHTLQFHESIQIGEFRIKQWPALDKDVDSLFQIQYRKLNVLNVVDSWIDWETCDLLVNQAPWDLVLWPFQTMREVAALSPSMASVADTTIPDEWLEQIEKLNPRHIVASSCQFRFEEWSWLNHFFFPISYASFSESMKEFSIPSENILPGDTYLLSEESFQKQSHLDFIVRDLEKDDFEYTYQTDLKIPSLAEMHKHISSLDEPYPQDIEDFIEQFVSQFIAQLGQLELKDLFQGLSYFENDRIWELKVYFSESNEKVYLFKVNSTRLEPLNDSISIDQVDWRTEILAIKLWGALKQGESLSSLYVRINDSSDVYNEETKDPLEDPLLAILYGRESFSYQKAQLRELRSGLFNKL